MPRSDGPAKRGLGERVPTPLESARRTAEEVRDLSGVESHDVAVVLGTGLSAAAEPIGSPVWSAPFADLSGFPSEVPSGQRAEMRSVHVGDLRVLVMLGRPHLYEGHSACEVAHPVRTAVCCGCSTVVLTNASGAIRDTFSPGDLVLVCDHLNLTAESPLEGFDTTRADEAGTPVPFVDMTDAWSSRLRTLAREVDPTLPEGVYAQVRGPQFETPAEIRMLRAMGADLVGMSSALESIAARHLGAEVLGVSLVTNAAAGVGAAAISAGSVVSVAGAAGGRLGALLEQVIRGIRSPGG